MRKFIITLVLSLTVISCGDSNSKSFYSEQNDQNQITNNEQSTFKWTGTKQEAYYYLESIVEDISNYVLNAHNIYFVSDNEFYDNFLTLSRKNLSKLLEIARDNKDATLEEKVKLTTKKIYVLDDAILNVVGNEKIDSSSYPSYINTAGLFQLKLFYAPACSGINQELYFMCIDQDKLKDYVMNNMENFSTNLSSFELLNDSKSFATWYRDHTKKNDDEKFNAWMNEVIADNINQVTKDAKISDLVDGALKDKPWFIRDLSCSEYASKIKEHASVQQPLIIKKLETILELIDRIKNDKSDSISLYTKELNTPIVSLTQQGSDLTYDETDVKRQAAKQAIEQISDIVSANFSTTTLLNSNTFTKYKNTISSIGALSTYVTDAGWEDLHDKINDILSVTIAYYDFYRHTGKITEDEQTKQNIDRCSKELDQINKIIEDIIK